MTDEKKKALAPEDIAEALGLHYDTVVRKLRSGEIPGRKIGRLWRTDKDTFNTWLQQGAEKSMEHSLIISDPNIMLGKPVIAGTRITVEHIMREITAGTTIEQLLEDHPGITREQIQAAINYGIAASAHPIPSLIEQASA